MTLVVFSQTVSLKKSTNESEIDFIAKTFKEISVSDQLYRNPLAKGTLDKAIINKIDSVYDSEGIQAGIVYEQSLNLKLPEALEDSLWQLQHAIDFRNHMFLRGIFEKYGWIAKEVVEEKNYVQILMLMHPPKDWNIPQYLEDYSNLLIDEVRAGRMPAKTYAMFYDNIKGKILREPQLYGTNQQFDAKTKKVMPPGIEDIEKSNEARAAIGLPALKKGEYRIVEGK